MTRKRDNVAALRRRLEADLKRLQLEVGQIAGDCVEQIGYANHMAEGASDAFEQARSLTLRGHLESLLLDVHEALRRLDEGTYGICQSCGQAIDKARLEALPCAALCLQCQVRAEFGARGARRAGAD